MRPLLVALTCIGILAPGCFSEDRKETFVQPLQQDVQLSWPTVGQAAIGTVEDGLLARSSGKEKERPIASMAKVITAVAVMEKQPFNAGEEGKTYIISEKDIASHKAYILQGGPILPIHTRMKVTQHQAMQRMLIASDNVMADILAERTFGSMKDYLSYAQDMLKRLGMSRTVVADASGFSRATVSTPSELVVIGIAALQNPVIARIVSRQEAVMPVTGLIKNTNRLLGTYGVIGIKTGTTADAGSCLLFAARYTAKDGEPGTIVGVIMGDTTRSSLYENTRDLLASAKHGFGLVEPDPENIFLPPSLNTADGKRQ